MYLDAEGMGTDNEDDAVYASLPGNAGAVGAGYTEALAAFLEARNADLAVETAQEALDLELKATVPSDVAIANARKDLAEAQAIQTTKHNALRSVGGGPMRIGPPVFFCAPAMVRSDILLI